MLLTKTSFPIFNGLSFGRRKIDGRNNRGRKTLYHRGGGVKKIYRLVDFKRYLWGVSGLPLTYEYSASRTSPTSLIAYSTGYFAFILSPINMILARPIISKEYDDYSIEYINYGCSSFIGTLKPGSYIHCIEIRPLRGAQYARTGGSFAKLVSTALDYSVVKLKSKILIKVRSSNVATLGVLSHWSNFIKKKAGTTRRRGFRPVVRGVAKNPVDHPHGGGQGKTSGGRSSVTPWSLITKGRKTKRKNTYVCIVMKTK